MMLPFSFNLALLPRSQRTRDGWPGEFFGVDFEARGEDIAMISPLGVKGCGRCSTRHDTKMRSNLNRGKLQYVEIIEQ
jgi:hypothetical protein